MSKIDTLIAEFTHNLRAAIAEEAAAAFAVIAGGGTGIVSTGRAKPGPKPKALAPAPKAQALPGKRSRRSPEDIEKQSAAVLAYVKKNPGTKAEHIGKALGLTSIELQIPIGNLLGEKKLGKKGERRATVYSAR